MIEDLVTYDTGKALANIGFKYKTRWLFKLDGTGVFYCPNSIRCPRCVKAPTLEQAAKFLREKGFHINVSYALAKEKWSYTLTKLNGGYAYVKIQFYDTYEAALSAGIDQSIKFLNNKI